MAEPAGPTFDVFVYGTLRRGFCNHHYLRRAQPLGRARTRDGYAMYLFGGIPSLLRRQPGRPVVGECYRVGAGVLAGLDRLEEHPHVYRREPAPVILADGAPATAWIYFALASRGFLADTDDFAAVAGPSVLSRL